MGDYQMIDGKTHSLASARDLGSGWTVSRKYTTSSDATGTVAITDAPASGQKIVADDILISVDTAMSVSVQEETSNTVFAKVYMAANSTVQLTLRDGIKAAVADKKLYIDTSAAGNIAVTCCWHSEA